MLNGKSLHLSDLTVQDLHLELIRRSQHNMFDGAQVVRDLLTHRDLWIAVLFDNDSLIKLRDLSENFWNVDMLYVLTSNSHNAQRLVELAERWHSEQPRIYSADETDRQLGGADSEDYRIVSFWWD